jgi:hypothetical protein
MHACRHVCMYEGVCACVGAFVLMYALLICIHVCMPRRDCARVLVVTHGIKCPVCMYCKYEYMYLVSMICICMSACKQARMYAYKQVNECIHVCPGTHV